MTEMSILDKSLASPRPRLQTGETLPDGSTVSHVVVKNESGVVQSAGTQTDPVHTVNVDPDGKVQGEDGYTPPSVTLKDSIGNEIEFPQIQTHTFHDAAVAAGDGRVFECNGEYSKLLIEITTTDADTQEIDFLGSIEGTNYYPLLGAKLETDGSITTNVKTTATTSEMWEIDITNRKYIKMDLVTLTGAGATVTVTGVVS